MILKLSKLFGKLKFVPTLHLKYFHSDFKPPWRILFFGTDEFSVYSLKALVNEYRKGELIKKLEVCTSIKKSKNLVHLFAERENLKLRGWPVDVTNTEFDTGLVVSFGHLLPQKIIEQFPLGMINIHASLLPRWRGAAPIIYSLANGDSITGVSIMKIKPKRFDTGEIISQKSIEISNDMCLPELHEELGQLGATEIVECLKDLPNNLKNAISQPEENISYAPKVDATFACINWQKMTSVQIYNLERAVKGFMPLMSTWNGETIKLFDVKKLGNCDNDLKEGSISYDDALNVLKVICSDKRYISVEKVQVFKKKVMSAKDFNNGYLKKVTFEKRYLT